jgi:hypothetical protein
MKKIKTRHLDIGNFSISARTSFSHWESTLGQSYNTEQLTVTRLKRCVFTLIYLFLKNDWNERVNSNTDALSGFTPGQTKQKVLLLRSPNIFVANVSLGKFHNVLELRRLTSPYPVLGAQPQASQMKSLDNHQFHLNNPIHFR